MGVSIRRTDSHALLRKARNDMLFVTKSSQFFAESIDNTVIARAVRPVAIRFPLHRETIIYLSRKESSGTQEA